MILLLVSKPKISHILQKRQIYIVSYLIRLLSDFEETLENISWHISDFNQLMPIF